MLKEKGELTDRAVIICQTPAVLQWVSEAARWVPKLRVEAAPSGLSKAQRVERYTTNWDVMVIGYHALIKDIRMFEKLEPGVVIADDVDPLLDHSNQKHRAITSLALRAERSVVINATNIQIRLQQIHAASVPVGGHDIFGSLTAFETKYLRKEPVTVWTKQGRKLRQSRCFAVRGRGGAGGVRSQERGEIYCASSWQSRAEGRHRLVRQNAKDGCRSGRSPGAASKISTLCATDFEVYGAR